MEQLWGPMTHYKNICHGYNFHMNSIAENKFMIFVAFQATYQEITPRTIQWDLTSIKKYCVIYENTDNFAKMKLLK